MTITYGTRPITFTAAFTNTAGIGTLTPANVQFLIDGTALAAPAAITATPTGGTAAFTVTWNLPIGSHTIKAKYLGNANFAPALTSGYTLIIH